MSYEKSKRYDSIDIYGTKNEKIFKINVCVISGKILDTGCSMLDKIRVVAY
jgi:hypothetical protein